MHPTDTAPEQQAPGPQLRVRLAPGTELLGRWEGSALEVPTYLIRRSDGQHVQVSALLYQLAERLRSTPGAGDVAAQLSDSIGREISAENVVHLVSAKLGPLGILAEEDQPPAPMRRANPLLGLRFRCAVVPAWLHRRVTTALTFLFWPPLVVLALGGLVASDTWIGLEHGAAVMSGANRMIAHPALVLALTVMTLVAAVIHETGHATATRAGGATPGVMGVGIYLVWPVFYTDITDTYRLGRAGRLRADLGGVYFNALTLLAAAIAYGATGSSLLLVFVVIMHVEVLSQFLPFVRLDGYWVVSDLIGVPNLFSYIGPTLGRLLRRSTTAADARLAQIKPWARKVITVWVVATAAVLMLNFAMMAWLGPLLVARATMAVGSRSHHLAAALSHHRWALGVDDGFSILFLVLPVAGVVYLAGLLLGRFARTLLRWRSTRPLAAAACTAALVALVALQVHSLASTYGSHRHPAGVSAAKVAAAGRPDVAANPGGTGAWIVQPDGSVTSTDSAPLFGSVSGIRLAAPTVALAATPDGGGYWLAGADGGVFAFGDARFFGSVAKLSLDGPIVSITAAPGGRGYWLAAADGGVFAFGDARFFGSLGGEALHTTIVGMADAAHGHGYWLAGTDGRVFAFGDAGSRARGPARANWPVTAIAATATGYQLDTPAGIRPFTVTAAPPPRARWTPGGTAVEVSTSSPGHGRSP